MSRSLPWSPGRTPDRCRSGRVAPTVHRDQNPLFTPPHTGTVPGAPVPPQSTTTGRGQVSHRTGRPKPSAPGVRARPPSPPCPGVTRSATCRPGPSRRRRGRGGGRRVRLTSSPPCRACVGPRGRRGEEQDSDGGPRVPDGVSASTSSSGATDGPLVSPVTVPGRDPRVREHHPGVDPPSEPLRTLSSGRSASTVRTPSPSPSVRTRGTDRAGRPCHTGRPRRTSHLGTPRHHSHADRRVTRYRGPVAPLRRGRDGAPGTVHASVDVPGARPGPRRVCHRRPSPDGVVVVRGHDVTVSGGSSVPGPVRVGVDLRRRVTLHSGVTVSRVRSRGAPSRRPRRREPLTPRPPEGPPSHGGRRSGRT